MKKWAAAVTGVYFLMLAALAWPAAICLGPADPGTALQLYGEWICWAWIGLLVAGQAALLLVPVGLMDRRPRPRRRLWVAIVATAFFLGLLAACLAFCLSLLMSRDFGPMSLAICGGILVLMWGMWTVVFWRFVRRMGPSAGHSWLMRKLFAGSALELLVAVPTHVVVRMRGDCCATMVTGPAIYTGIAVMLMSFGPGVFILYSARRKLLLGRGKCRKCGYDLRATPERCPECGMTRQRRA